MSRKKRILQIFLLFSDAALIFLTLFLALGIRFGDFSFLPGPNTRVFVWHFAFVMPIWLLLLYLLDFYRIPPVKNIFYFLCDIFIFAFLAGVFAVFYFYIQPEKKITPKTILLLHVFFFCAAILAERLLLKEVLSLKNSKEKVKVLGEGVEFSREEVGGAGFKIVDELEEADTVVVLPEFLKREDGLKEKFSTLPLSLNYVRFSDFWEEVTKKVPIGKVDEAWFLENVSKKESKVEKMVRRVFDMGFLLFGAGIGVFLCPLIALAIKLESRGPVIYKQVRVGKGGGKFTLYKFRTMKEGAEENGPQWSGENDSRVTKTGGVLRKTHLDELPQLVNILKGELSVVGPRPERPHFVEKLKKEIPFYDIRHSVRPGITGWAQINYPYGASVKDAREKLKYDFYYIKNRSLALDASILLKTARIVVRDLFNIAE